MTDRALANSGDKASPKDRDTADHAPRAQEVAGSSPVAPYQWTIGDVHPSIKGELDCFEGVLYGPFHVWISRDPLFVVGHERTGRRICGFHTQEQAGAFCERAASLCDNWDQIMARCTVPDLRDACLRLALSIDPYALV